MRMVLSTIGSRGDVQPLVALALVLRSMGQEAVLCVPPDFVEWIEGLGLTVTAIGPELRSTARPAGPTVLPTPEQRRQMAEQSIATQFETISRAAHRADAIVGATALQIAAPSVAEQMGIPYVFAAYSPNVLPSIHHAPPVYTLHGDSTQMADPSRHAALWAENADRFNTLFAPALNTHRAVRGLAPVSDLRSHVFTATPWLAADPTLGPWPDPTDRSVLQTGAWILDDDRPLPPEVEKFLEAGEPPVYFGFGSIRTPDGIGRTMIASARAVGRRAMLSRGWADLSLDDAGADCLAIGEINQQRLFMRVAAVVHHGGAGTTTAAARAGAPQVVIPQHYDQPYWAGRVQHLGIGAAHPPETPGVASLTQALERALASETVLRARAVAASIRSDGAEVAARHLIAMVGSRSTSPA